MNRHHGFFQFLLVGILLVGLGAFVSSAEAVEPARAFLDGLRERQMFDMAMAYIDQMRTSPLCPPDFKEILDYEAGITLVAGARTVRDQAAKEKQLAEARASFQRFLKERADHPLASGASTQLANVLVERGRMKVDEAGKSTTTPEQKKALLAEARKLYEEAQGVFKEAEERFLAELKKLPPGMIEKTKVKLIEKRDQLRRDLVQARLFLATVAYELAKTYPPDGKEAKKYFEDAAKQYHELYGKYGSRLAGLYARMWEGRCYKELKDKKKALAIFDEILIQPDEPAAFRNLKNKALVLFLETCMLPGATLADYKLAAERADAWEKEARGPEESSEDGLAIRYLGATAWLEYARLLEKDDPARSKSLSAARKALNFVTRFPGEYKRDAQAKLMDPLLRDPDAEVPEPTNFEEARDRGKAELDKMVAAQTMLSMDAAEGKKDKLEEYNAQYKAAQDAAVKYFRMALGMKTGETSLDEVNVVRYYLTYLYWAAQEPYDAAVMGEFLARRYANSPGGRQGAKIAMAAYALLFNEAQTDEDRDFATRRMFHIADYITGRWPDGPEADEARIMLIRTSVVAGKLDKALECLPQIPPESPRRAEAELMVGRALWASYLKAARLPEDEKPPQEKLDQMLANAQKTLEEGVARMNQNIANSGAVNSTVFTAVLSLVQIYVDAGEPEKAIKWLEDPKIGILTLVKADHPVTKKNEYDVATYKAALRAYVAAQQLDKAEEAMNSLETLVAKGGDAEAGKKLTLIYISLGRELQELLERLRSEKKTDQVKKVSQGFELFLTRISQREEGNTFNSLNWVAETFMGLGAGLDPGGKTLPPEAQKYYEKAAETYQSILKRLEAEPGFAPEGDASTGVRVRLAKCLRRLGQYKEAMNMLVGILLKRNMMIDAQVQAAYTYQAWGQEKPGYYLYAIKGGKKNKRTGKYVVWGWGKIARLVASHKQHRDVFHEARYNLAVSRLKLALSQTGKEKKETLEQAQTDIEIVQRLYPEMGGDEWRGKYDGLLKQIQRLRGEKAVGLKPRAEPTASR